ncbi:hypothetical protein FM037_08210 [Shewanella psychropiezotolerans]|uniref:ABC transporter substrate-binding protein n=1 Tax=Shewanella psychropiezotolerans TaxID=2593655 RepID=A0ABX5WVU2_9GAMM|nr:MULTISPECIES: hypothetical protein [Shewanella]MPY22471.1 hypothetical protein [Shewanella sp. YLB-07]QDO83216.1 hypothetical protein FM037_08210 [Shewanella psychropiezotolerans]
MKNTILLLTLLFTAAQANAGNQAVFQWSGTVPMAHDWSSKPLNITENYWQKGLNLQTKFITIENQTEVARNIVISIEKIIDKNKFKVASYNTDARTYKLIIESKI